MTSKKITEMPVADTLEADDLLTAVDVSAAVADQNVKITKANLQAGLLPDDTALGTDSGELTGGGNLSSGLSLGLAFAATATGAFTNADITVDAFGRVTAAASGPGAAPRRYNVNAIVSGDVFILLDGRSINVNISDGVTSDLVFTTAGDDFNQENTCSFDLVFAGAGTVSIPGTVEQMGTFGVITGTAGAIVTCVARSRQNGTIQLYRSAKVTS